MPLMKCRCCGEFKSLDLFPVRRDLVVPIPRSECKDCRRKAQNVRRHGVEEIKAAPALDLAGFLPWPAPMERRALVWSIAA